VIWTISASPWNQAKMALREAMLRDAVRQHHVPIVFVNLVGGNDELIFDGTSFAVDRDARVVARLARFAEDFAVIDPFARAGPRRRRSTPTRSCSSARWCSASATTWASSAAPRGDRLSGGIDSR
jgi:predicted amidohydrolase